VSQARIGIDVGGTAVKLGAVHANGEVIGETEFTLAQPTKLEQVLDEATRMARGFSSAIGSVGVGLPGLLDREAGIVEASPNLPWLEKRPVRDMLAERFGLEPAKVRLENDANVAALGELWLGAARGNAHVLVATLGTGIGGGLILNEQLYIGEGLAGEVGHLVLDPQGPRCGCGGQGCLEQYASASAAIRRAKSRQLPAEDPGNLKLLSQRAAEGPGPERDLLEEVGCDLGHGFAQVLSLLDIRTFVIGGGFGRALDQLITGIRRGLHEWAYGERVEQLRIIPAELGPKAGWIGAARLVDLP
jgi:glucokinase